MNKQSIIKQTLYPCREKGMNSCYFTFLFVFLFFSVIFSGCDRSSSNGTPDNLQPEAETVGDYSQPASLNDDLKSISGFDSVLDYNEFNKFIEIEPNKDLRCPLPNSQEFKEIAHKLGGFQRPYQIPVEKDATVPRLYSGLQKYDALFEVAKDSTAQDVDIQRPDIIGRSDNIGFYLSDAYGLIIVHIDPDNPLSSETGCTMALPGRPKNFILKDNTLIAIINSMDGYNSGLIQFSVSENQLTYVTSLFFENQIILDARLFNNVLSVYTTKYDLTDDVIRTQPEDRSTASMVIDDFDYIPRRAECNRLMVLDILPELNLKNTETFWPTERTKDGTPDKFESHFNTFLSASGQYLVVTESQTEHIFQHYETRYYSVCTNYEEKTYNECSTNWKRILNPDYVPPASSGTFVCNDILINCLKTIGPRVAKYIYVPDGETCRDYVRSICTASEYKSWDYPVYKRNSYTKFHVFRFKDDQFFKLDATLARVSEDAIQSTEDPFRIEGHIAKHDHIMFHNDILYAIAEGQRLNVFTIQGNSPIYVSGLDLGYTGYVEMNVNFTEDRIYISNSIRNWDTRWTDMQTINIENPIKPSSENKISIPTRLDQLVFDKNALIGIGQTTINIPFEGNYYFGTFTLFSALGQEVNSLMLGTDYKYYYHAIGYDDQVLNFDRMLGRLLLPYTVYSPFDPEMPINANRITMADISSDNISEIHTFAFNERPERSLSINADLAFTFSDHLINMLYNDKSWNQLELFYGEVPSSIYPCRTHPCLVKKYNQDNQYTFVLIDDASLTKTDAIDILTIPKSASNYCTWEQVYFDNDRLLIVSEPPGVYFGYDECAGDGTDIKSLTGYRITDTGFAVINDKNELETLYTQIIKDVRCIIDLDNKEGVEIYNFDEIPGEATCFTKKQYDTFLESSEIDTHFFIN